MSPEIWLGPSGHVDSNSLGYDPSVCIFCIVPLKLITESAETDSSSNEFQRLINNSFCKKSVGVNRYELSFFATSTNVLWCYDCEKIQIKCRN